MPRILVVDDDVSIRRMVADVLSLEGYETLSAEDGFDALHVLSGGERVDCVILDVMMPGMNGHEVLQRIRAHADVCNVPVVMLTAAADDSHAWQAWTEGVDYFLAKPFNPDELLRYLDYLFNGAEGEAFEQALVVL